MNEHDSPLDAVDAALLQDIARLYDAADPPPASLDDDVVFAVSLAAVDAEIATLLDGAHLALRAGEASPTDTVTFTSSALQLMLRTAEDDAGALRIDGWVTGGGIDVALISGTTAHWTTSDAHGRLVWRDVPRGPLRFLLHPAEPGGKPVMTPVIEF
ncbi:hypothetical protein ACQ3I4_08500 [Zafaria sp. Z1313]|uniref:hypothetical protein n=1 Tax=unclassified Zafaria TaxID=2828765 RepID=UPI002E766F19|nr:hypothetical protein [Zafaria sp. J156]MEE1620956.1 hypothetical protein [Zafaria sp. J156]